MAERQRDKEKWSNAFNPEHHAKEVFKDVSVPDANSFLGTVQLPHIAIPEWLPGGGGGGGGGGEGVDSAGGGGSGSSEGVASV
jgi:hypothetical protein